MERIIPRLRLIRWKRGLTQRKLAQMAEIPLWKIIKWEGGRRIPTLREAVIVQRALEKIEKPELFVLNPIEFKEARGKLPRLDVPFFLLLGIEGENIEFAILQ